MVSHHFLHFSTKFGKLNEEYEDILAQSIVLLAEDAPEYFAAPVSPPYGKEETCFPKRNVGIAGCMSLKLLDIF